MVNSRRFDNYLYALILGGHCVAGEEANHSCVKFSGGKINYRTDEELVSSLGSAFIAINFLNFRRSFIIGM